MESKTSTILGRFVVLFIILFLELCLSACMLLEQQQSNEESRGIGLETEKTPAAIPLVTQEEAEIKNFEAIIVNDIQDDIKIIVNTELIKHHKKLPHPHPLIGINHCGWYEAPENTLVAYILSKEHGFNYVETDIRFTIDGIPVLLHDETINRTARNSNGTEIKEITHIGSITYEEALEYDFGIYKGDQFRGTKISRFDDFIALCKYLNLHPFVELKGGSKKQIESLAETVKRYGMEGYVTWISFSATCLEYIKSYDDHASLGYLILAPIEETHISSVEKLKTAYNNVFINCAYNNLADEDIMKCLNANIPLMVWTVNSKKNILSLDPYISGVTSDTINAEDLFLNWNINGRHGE